jgi:hypothetical protein
MQLAPRLRSLSTFGNNWVDQLHLTIQLPGSRRSSGAQRACIARRVTAPRDRAAQVFRSAVQCPREHTAAQPRIRRSHGPDARAGVRCAGASRDLADNISDLTSSDLRIDDLDE